MPRRARFLLVAALGALGACASSGTETSPRPDSQRITRTELDELAQMGVRNLREAIDRTRPRWLVVRSGMRSFAGETEIVVFQDETYAGNLDALDRMGLEGVYEIRLVDGSTAQATLPGIQNRHIQHAIVVHMRPPPGR